MKLRCVELYRVTGWLCLASILIWLNDLDLVFARWIVGPDNQWPGVNSFPWNMLYTWASLPGVVLAGGAALVLLAGFFISALQRFRKQSLFLVLLLAIGPGLLVNVLLKDQLGRARPREVVEFGGAHQFSQILQPGTTGENSSFPSGHASVAFYLMAPWFIWRSHKKIQAIVSLGGGISFGILVGLARMLQGAHFASDVLWAGGLVYLAGGTLALLLKLDAPQIE
ncbi:MAG: phosphatase PAP2 family protein [Desulfobulbaceae bacterium]|nr:phosphatase PAP2 family protein [Desulfobulbaceae bacterium]